MYDGNNTSVVTVKVTLFIRYTREPPTRFVSDTVFAITRRTRFDFGTVAVFVETLRRRCRRGLNSFLVEMRCRENNNDNLSSIVCAANFHTRSEYTRPADFQPTGTERVYCNAAARFVCALSVRRRCRPKRKEKTPTAYRRYNNNFAIFGNRIYPTVVRSAFNDDASHTVCGLSTAVDRQT